MDEMSRKRGRPKGAVGRPTRESRAAIAAFVQQQLPRLDMLLGQIINGLPKVDREGEPIRDKEGSVVYVVKPDPQAGFKCLTDIIEYHIPRLSRSEATVVAQVEQVQRIEDVPTDVLRHRLMVSLGITAEDVEVVIPVLKPEGE